MIMNRRRKGALFGAASVATISILIMGALLLTPTALSDTPGDTVQLKSDESTSSSASGTRGDDSDREGERTLFVAITSICDGDNTAGGPASIGFTLASRAGYTWVAVLDEGHGTSTTSQTDGLWIKDDDASSPTWVRVTTESGGEGRLRASFPEGTDLVRLTYDGWTSTAVPPTSTESYCS